MKVLVTGANGYLGTGIVKQLLNNHHEVIATDLDLSNVDDRAIKSKDNIFNLENPFEYFNKPDVLLHLAWKDGFVHYSDSHIEDLPKHYNFIHNYIKNGGKHVAVMGTVHEIGFYEGSINENTPCNPTTPYGISKNALRCLTKDLCKKYNAVFQWLRAFYIVGNNLNGSSIFSKIALAAKENKIEFPFTLGQNQFDFLDYKEFCTQVAFAVSQCRVQGIINICSGKPEKLADRVEQFISDNKYPVRLRYGAFPEREYDSKAIWGDNSKILTILNNK